jgi:hypothetical protein
MGFRASIGALVLGLLGGGCSHSHEPKGSGTPACSAPQADADLGTGNLVFDAHVAYSGDEVTLPCNEQGTTLDRVYRWKATSTKCIFFNARVSGQGNHPFFAVLGACKGEVLACGQGGSEFQIEAGKTYLLAAEPFTAGDDLGGIEVVNHCL